jgi:hypothetical protein
MKNNLNFGIAGLFISLLISATNVTSGQSEKSVVKKYLNVLPSGAVNNTPQKYRMTAVYTNRDLYGNFTGKTKVTGDYTKGLADGFVLWNNIYISTSNSFGDPFPAGKDQTYMENMKYIPSPEMLKAEAFKNFPSSTESVFAKTLIWDMYSFELFAWKYYDSLKLNKPFEIPDINGSFDMADIGKYTHNKIILCWTGITALNDDLYAVIEFNAIDNMIEMNMEQIRSKGTEQYWGTILLSLKTKSIGHAVMYSGTMQEIEVNGMKEKFLVKTIREVDVDKIQ